MEIESVRISDLVSDPNNARKHDEKNLAAIKGSLTQFGQRKPIVVKGNVVIAGNGTLEAAKSLGWDEIEIVQVPEDWTADQAKAYALADNRSAELATWDQQVLSAQVLELKDAGFEVADFGFEAIEPEEPKEEEDLEPLDDSVEPVAKLGDVYRLGRHRLMCGDSTSIDDVDKLTESKTMDMAFTDPPYGVAYTGGIQFKDKDSGVAITNNREMIKNDDVDIYEDVMSILSLKVDGPCYVWFAGTKAAKLYQAAETYGDIHALIIWVKNGGYGALNANYKQKHEPCLYWKPTGKTLKFAGPTTETTIWEINKDGKNKLHPTQKPVDLAFKAIKNHDAKSVLDLFGGSGATLIAAEQLNRSCYMMELDPKYVDVIIKRWETLTGQKAELVS